MKTYLFYAFLAGILFVFSACKEESQTIGLEVIDVETAYRHPSEIRASDYFSHIRYVPLETSDSVLIGKSPSLFATGDKLVITSEQHPCFAFDKENGAFRNVIGHIGNDPTGSVRSDGWFNEKNACMYFPAGNFRSVVYDLNNNFKGYFHDIERYYGFYGAYCYTWLDSTTLAAHFPANDKLPDRVILFRDTTRLATIAVPHSTISLIPSTTEEMETFQVFQKLICGHDVLYLHFKNQLVLPVIPAVDPFWHAGDKLYFKELYNDTIYRVSQTDLLPERVFDFGSMRYAFEDRYKEHKDHAIFPLDIYENQTVLWMRFAVDILHPKACKNYNLLYNKQKQKAQVAPFQEGISNDLTHFLSLQPSYANAEGEFFQLLSAEEIADWFDSHPEVANLPPEVEQLRHLTPDDNPVVVIMK
ncbi:hypothetical protein B5F77_05275 [Parabacteroides sp. An277]|uniref:DUF4934 domain-containing protein n=1 Tax=Parabacteroides sp. An277 TaxID=1965619 RepID=UPI000B370C60|nr:DUF4934 domain-containing protein [Parabacteroides sp. An277]OUO53740.1 hypothetical protein B5F77_05275 [Parabacteroides sp. An277]